MGRPVQRKLCLLQSEPNEMLMCVFKVEGREFRKCKIRFRDKCWRRSYLRIMWRLFAAIFALLLKNSHELKI